MPRKQPTAAYTTVRGHIHHSSFHGEKKSTVAMAPIVAHAAEADRATLIGRLSQRADAEWLAELLIDLEEDESARLHLIEALQRL
jgi:hypothetical protein